ncbi:MAG: flotillin family protein [Gemmatimonadota bacterium]
MDTLLAQLPIGALGTGFIVVMAVGLVVAALLKFLLVVPPNVVSVITGATRESDGELRGYRLVSGGRTLVIPILERVQYLSLDVMQVNITVKGAISKGGIALNVDAVANVKVASRPAAVLANAIERLLDRDPNEIKRLANETLMAALRGVLATLTPEEANEDRERFERALLDEASRSLASLGLELDLLKLQQISDDNGYLIANARARTAEVLRNAEIAEAQAKSLAEISRAEADQLERVAEANASRAVSEAENQLRVRRAQLEQEAETTEKVARAAALEAEARAQQAVQLARAELEERRLLADVIKPAEAAQRRALLEAQAAAAPLREEGKARAEATAAILETLQRNPEQAIPLLLLQQLPALVQVAADGAKGMSIEKLIVMDGGQGNAIGNATSARVAGTWQLLEGAAATLGIDLKGLVNSLNQTRRVDDGE